LDGFIDGSSTRQFQNNAVFLIPIEERYTDETDAFVWKRGLLTLSTNGTTDIVRTADELNTRFFPRPADDPETEEDESQNIPAPLTTGSLTTEVTEKSTTILNSLTPILTTRLLNKSDTEWVASEYQPAAPASEPFPRLSISTSLEKFPKK
jgi:hypothetical protein